MCEPLPRRTPRRFILTLIIHWIARLPFFAFYVNAFTINALLARFAFYVFAFTIIAVLARFA